MGLGSKDLEKFLVASKLTNKVLVVEVEPRALQLDSDNPSRDLASLQGHPGFSVLLSKFKLQQAYLNATLRQLGPNATLGEMQDLLSGIKWLGYAENAVRAAVFEQETRGGKPIRTRKPLTTEEAEFAQIRRAVDQKDQASYLEELEELERMSEAITIVGRPKSG